MSAVVLGIDGGGSATRLAVADRDGAVTVMERGETVDPFAEPDAWPDRLAAMIGRADALLPRLAAAVVALPCHGEVPAVSRRQAAVVGRLVAAPHEVVNDVQAAFDGALAGQAGVLLLAGTGSMAWAGDGERQRRCGGWGDAFGDEGSAHWIGREALSQATRALDGRCGVRSFADALLARMGVAEDALLTWCYAAPSRRAAIAGVAAVVDRLAEAGDPSARDLLERAADHLADHALACSAPLGLGPSFRWSHAGSVFLSRTVMARTIARLGRPPNTPRLPPVGGALVRAARQAGWTLDDGWIDRLAVSLDAADRSASSPSKGERS